MVGSDGEKGESSVDESPSRAKYEDFDYSEYNGKPVGSAEQRHYLNCHTFKKTVLVVV